MPIQRLADMIGRESEWRRLTEFATSGEGGASLGLVWGRRRIGKSFLLQDLAAQTQGFYYHAVRGSSGEALRDLGEHLGRHVGAIAPLTLETWEDAIAALMELGRQGETLVVLDEFPYLLEHTPALDSVIQRFYAPRAGTRRNTQTRLILCGSAMSVMSQLLAGTAPLRGRAALDLRMQPFDFRTARELHGCDDLEAAVLTYAVIGGVPAYAREMTGSDLPRSPDDFARWIAHRVLSPSAPLFGEVDLLLGEDPALSRARKPNLYHSTLAGVALGNHAWSSLTNYVRIAGGSLAPVIKALVTADFITEIQDPVRENRPVYHPADPLIRFHYAIIRRHQTRLRRHGADPHALWQEFVPTFRSQVLGPCFESMARSWAMHFASQSTLGGAPSHVGPTTLSVINRETGAPGQREVDVVVAADDAEVPTERTVRVLGEAKVAERLSLRHLQRLEDARSAMGAVARSARLLLFGQHFDAGLISAADERDDVEIIDLRRLYSGD
ncbi:MAG: ATP-binding protein [Gemmatimonadales bacterium]|nr:MAG: ATP-binding protein [Gemmatimonadales bacterium]